MLTMGSCHSHQLLKDLLKRAQEMLANSNLPLHKIALNNSDVMEAFLPEDHAKSLQNLDFDDS